MVPDEGMLRRNTPVYINTYNLPTYTRRLVQSFRRNGFGNIIVIDQASDNPEARQLLDELEATPGCRVDRRRTNRGPRYFFDSLRYLTAGRHFFYTDPDIELPDQLPEHFVTDLLEVSGRLRVGKVGCALDLSDSHLFDTMVSVQEGESTAMTVVDYEARYWKDEVEPDVYRASVDTTLALYDLRYFRLWHFFRGVRVAGAFCVKHRPWYVDKMMPRAEADFYAARCRYSSWLNKDRSGKSLFAPTPATYLIGQVKLARWNWWQFKGAVSRWLAADDRAVTSGTLSANS